MKTIKTIVADFFAGSDFNNPFQDAIDFQRQKVNIPTKTWRDLQKNQHDRGFVVAGVERDDMLSDLRNAVDEAISKGETLEGFKARFDEIARKNGWLADKSAKYRAWRARVIYETNLRTSYQAGRYKQMTTPEMRKARPYWRYVHAQTREPKIPRPLHLSWDGIVLSMDDPWWKAHFPPNGWLCTCGVTALSAGDLKRMGINPDEAPNDGARDVVDPDTGEITQVPNGIDEGWDYTPGEEWAKNAAPKIDQMQEKTNVSPSKLKAVIEDVKKFFAKFFGASSFAEQSAFQPFVFTDAIGAPLLLSAAMFQNAREDWIVSGDLMRALPAIADALVDPDEIRLAFLGPRQRLTRIYRRGPLSVFWSKAAWSYSEGQTAEGIAVYKKAKD